MSVKKLYFHHEIEISKTVFMFFKNDLLYLDKAKISKIFLL